MPALSWATPLHLNSVYQKKFSAFNTPDFRKEVRAFCFCTMPKRLWYISQKMVAEKCGVSKNVTSIVLRGDSESHRISEETRTKIVKTAAELGFNFNYKADLVKNITAQVGIYKITAPDDRIYIGQTRNFYKRIQDHGHDFKNKQLTDSINQHGKEAHKFELIYELPPDVNSSILNVYEVLFISKYKECGLFLFNISPGGGKHANSSIDKMREIGYKRTYSEETRKKMSESAKNRPPNRKGAKLSEEQKAKIRALREGIK